MTSCRGVIWLLLTLMTLMVSNTCLSEPSSPPANATRWELLEVAADRIRIDGGASTLASEGFRYYLWNLYKKASRSQRLEIVDQMSEAFKRIAYRDNSLDMIGLILFGPEKGPAFLRLGDDMLPEPEPADVLDYEHCLTTVEHLFTEHCGPRTYLGFSQTPSLTNLCTLATQAAIEDAIIHSCGLNIVGHVPYRYPAFGTGLPFVSLSAVATKWGILNQDADGKWVAHRFMHRVRAVTATFLSDVGSPLAIAVTAFSLALKYVIDSVIARKKKSFRGRNLQTVGLESKLASGRLLGNFETG